MLLREMTRRPTNPSLNSILGYPSTDRRQMSLEGRRLSSSERVFTTRLGPLDEKDIDAKCSEISSAEFGHTTLQVMQVL